MVRHQDEEFVNAVGLVIVPVLVATFPAIYDVKPSFAMVVTFLAGS
jgi:hypothetical protein